VISAPKIDAMTWKEFLAGKDFLILCVNNIHHLKFIDIYSIAIGSSGNLQADSEKQYEPGLLHFLPPP
jgi:hypothetical protein